MSSLADRVFMSLQFSPLPAIDSGTCAVGAAGADGCRACLERCPYDAIDLRSRPDGYEVRVDPLACQRCGACSGVCPTSAIERPFLPDGELVASLAAAARAADGPVIGITCPESAPRVTAALGAEHVVVTPSLLVINETHLAAAIAAGARGVLLVGCPRCTHLQPESLQEPLDVARAMLDDPRRVAYVEYADRTDHFETALRTAAELPTPTRVLDDGAMARLEEATTRRARLAELLTLFGPGTTAPMSAAGFGQVELDQDACIACGACAASCPTDALVLDPTVASITVTDLDCIGCGACTSACPDDAISVASAVPVGVGALRPRILLTDESVACVRCGERYAARRLLDHARSVVEDAGLDPSDPRLQLGVCPTCRNPEGRRPPDDTIGTDSADRGNDSPFELAGSCDQAGPSRRRVLSGAATALATGAVLPLFRGTASAAAAEQDHVAGRMGMVIDLERCIGCHACSNACKAENNVPLGKFRDWVEEHVVGEYPDARPVFLPKLCNHCDDPGCLRACPTGAIFKRADGIVDLDASICIACKACMTGCPYGMTFMNHTRGTSDKCNLCSHRIDQGLQPACVDVCPSKCRIVGDFDDPESPVSRYIADRDTTVLREELGLGPNVRYVGLPGDLER